MTRADNQREQKRSFRMPRDLARRITEYADERAMSRSEVIREAMALYAKGKVHAPNPDARPVADLRIDLWIGEDLKMYKRFTDRVKRDRAKYGVRIFIADAIEAAFEQMQEEES